MSRAIFVGLLLAATAPGARAEEEGRTATSARSSIFKTSLGLAQWKLYGVAIRGGSLSLAIGREVVRRAELYVGVEAFRGATEEGLVTWSAAPAITLELKLVERWRVAAEARAGVVAVERATVSSSSVFSRVGVGVSSSLDLLRWDEQALFIRAAGGFDGVGGDELLWEVSAGLGLRL